MTDYFRTRYNNNNNNMVYQDKIDKATKLKHFIEQVFFDRYSSETVA